MNERAASNAYSFQLDDVLYQRGLIFAHPSNPQRDYKKAEESFLRIVEEHPQSPHSEEAKVWIALFNEMENLEMRVRNAQSEVGILQGQLEEKDQQLVAAKERVKLRDQELITMEDQLQKLQAELRELKGQIERLKEIDLGIDDKKRDAQSP
jgi:chromosome segregation ATPase